MDDHKVETGTEARTETRALVETGTKTRSERCEREVKKPKQQGCREEHTRRPWLK